MKFARLAAALTALSLLAGACFADVADLKAARIGAQAGSVSEDFARGFLGDKARLTTYERIGDVIKALKEGTIDAAVMDETPARYFAAADPDKLMILPEALDKEEYAIAFKKGSPLLEPVNKALAEFKADGTLWTILRKYQVGDGADPSEIDLNSGAEGESLWVGCAVGFPPYDMRTPDGFSGIDVELCAAIARKLGRPLVMVDYSFNDLPSALEHGRVDMVCSAYAVTEERKKVMDFSEPYDANMEVVVVRKEGTN